MIPNDEIEYVLSEASKLDMTSAINYLQSKLYLNSGMSWEHFDALLVEYQRDRNTITANYILTYALICPKNDRGNTANENSIVDVNGYGKFWD